MARPDDHASIAIIGASICGVSFLERLIANYPELTPDSAMTVYMIDPHPAGAGRVWRDAQPDVLQSNSIAGNLTMFTDDSVTCEGPILPGPSLPEWAQAVQSGAITVDHVDAPVRAELDVLGEWSYPSRRLVAAYLTWAFEQISGSAPEGLTVQYIPELATSIVDLPSGQQEVRLAGESKPIRADAVVLAVGHLDAERTAEERMLAEFAAKNGAYYLASGYSADVDLSGITPGMPVIVRGLGLAFIDLMALLTEERGGQYKELPDGRLSYVPSGREPVLWAGSRRGVPHSSKPGYRLPPSSLELPRFCDAEAIDAELSDGNTVDFARDLDPRIQKELAWSYYHELFSAHPDRTAMSLDEFDEAFAACEWGSEAMGALVASAVPAEADRLELDKLDRPLQGARFESTAALCDFVCQYIGADLARRESDQFGADMRLVKGFSSVVTQISQLDCLSRLEPSARRANVDGRLMSLYKMLGSGPPPTRLRQLIALTEAGIVRFLGSEMWVEADEPRGIFRAGSSNVNHVVEARALIEARLPDPTVSHSASPLIRSLRDAGAVTEHAAYPQGGDYEQGLLAVDPTDARVVDVAGVAQPRRFALGPFTSSAAMPSFIVPKSNAVTLRQNDAAARQLLRTVASADGSRAEGIEVSSIYESSLDRGATVVAP